MTGIEEKEISSKWWAECVVNMTKKWESRINGTRKQIEQIVNDSTTDNKKFVIDNSIIINSIKQMNEIINKWPGVDLAQNEATKFKDYCSISKKWYNKNKTLWFTEYFMYQILNGYFKQFIENNNDEHNLLFFGILLKIIKLQPLQLQKSSKLQLYFTKLGTAKGLIWNINNETTIFEIQQVIQTKIRSMEDKKLPPTSTNINDKNTKAKGRFRTKRHVSFRRCSSMSMGSFTRGAQLPHLECEASSLSVDDMIGFAVGGSRDTNNFRKCIKENIMPSINSISYNGLLYEYYFDTQSIKHDYYENTEQKSNDNGSMLFYPSYCSAKTMKLKFGIDEKEESNEYSYYLSVGLNSNIKQSEFKRKHLNLVIVLDISGSMTSPFKDDQKNDTDNKENEENEEWRNKLKIGDCLDVKDVGWNKGEIIDMSKNYLMINYVGWNKEYDELFKVNSQRLKVLNTQNTKFKAAKHAINILLKHLTPSDRIGLVTFEKNAKIEQKLQFINDLNMKQFEENISSNIHCCGGTNFENGYLTAMNVYDELFNDDEYLLNNASNDEKYSNRVIILTDAQPNIGKTDENSLLSMINQNAENKTHHIYTSFIGVGLDFNSSLIEIISQTRGCNYYSVQSRRDFNEKMDEKEFEYMVTPLVFNVCLKLNCEGNLFQIEKVYSSNDEQENKIIKNGEITKINTLFPSKTTKKNNKQETKGGIQIIKLIKKKTDIDDNNNDMNISLEVSFEDRNGKTYKNIQNISFKSSKITRKNMNDMIETDNDEKEENNMNFYDNKGIRKGILLCKYVEIIKQWIKNDYNGHNKPLKLNENDKKILISFSKYFQNEMIKCNDDTLKQEVDILQKLINLN